MTELQPFQVDIDEGTIATIKARVADYPWHEMPDDGGWDYGTNLEYLKELCGISLKIAADNVPFW